MLGEAVVVEGFGGFGVDVPVAQVKVVIEDAEVAEISGWVRVPLVALGPSLIDLPGAPTTSGGVVGVVGASWLAVDGDVTTALTPCEVVEVHNFGFGETGITGRLDQVRAFRFETEGREGCGGCGGWHRCCGGARCRRAAVDGDVGDWTA